MSEATQKAVNELVAQKATEALARKHTEITDYMLTKRGTLIVGSELVGEKLTALLCEAMNTYDNSHPIAVVLSNDGYPEDAFGMTYADTFSMVINLQRCWDHACAVAIKGDKQLSFLGVLWTTVLSAYAHELDHLDLSFGDRDLYELMRSEDEGQKDLETSAKDNEINMICALARVFDTEIPAPSELGWFGLQWMALHTDDATKDLPWVVKARTMVEDGFIYQEEGLDVVTFRDFVKKAYEQEGDGWEQATAPVHLSTYIDGEETVLVAEPVIAPVVDKVEPAEAVVAAQAPAGMFVSAGVEVADDGAEEIVMVGTTDTDGSPTIDFVNPEEAQAVAAATNTAAAAVEAVLAVPMVGGAAVQAEVVAAAAATAMPPAPGPTPTTYTPAPIDSAVMPMIMEKVWKVIYHHIFTKCGWMQNPQSGRFCFSNAAAVLEGVNIQHILTEFGADNFIMEYDTLNAQGQPAAEQCQGMIRGYTTSKQGLPAYSLYLNIGGQRYKRTFLPQNPEKRNAQNAYTNSAADSAAGHQIAWVFKDEAADSAPFKEKCAVKITNSVNGIIYEVIS